MGRAWRIIKKAYADHAFAGEGSHLYGSRWTTPGHPVNFAAESLSLAVLEVLVPLQSIATLADYAVFRVTFADGLVEDLNRSILPPTWRESPAPAELQAIGDAWTRGGSSLLLRVPSVIVPHESDFLINPAHPHFNEMIIEGPDPLEVDPRLFR